MIMICSVLLDIFVDFRGYKIPLIVLGVRVINLDLIAVTFVRPQLFRLAARI
ncbi:hypothetical protein D3C81_1256500 [compost metagenome]